jgi:ribosome maturation factor RimP
MKILEELKDFVEKEACKLGFTVLEVSVKGRFGLAVEIILDKNGGITLEECSKFNLTVSSWLENSDVAGKGYTVDVASPGIDRVLKSDADFNWAVGKKVKINISPGEGVVDLCEGELRSYSSGKAVVVTGTDNEIEIHKKDIVKAQLSPDI